MKAGGLAPPGPEPAAVARAVAGSLVITTAHRTGAGTWARAEEVAERCGAPLVERENLERLRQHAPLVYVVGRKEEFVMAADGRLVGGEGLMKLKKLDGLAHPLVRAVTPAASPARLVFDGTLGLAQDALHLSVVAGLTIDGVDASPALVCLVENFLRRATGRWGEAPTRIRPRDGEAYEVLRRAPADAYDVVYFDPMFDVAMPAQPEFRLLRRLAREAPLDHATLAEAVRVARQRVVVKVRTLGDPGVEPPAPGWNRRVAARAFNYWVVEKALPDPVLDPLSVRYSHQKLRFLGLLDRD